MEQDYDNSGETWELGDVTHFRKAGTKAVADVQKKYCEEFTAFLTENLPEGAALINVRHGRAHFELHISVEPGTSMAPFHRIIKLYNPSIDIEGAYRGFSLVVPYVEERTEQQGGLCVIAVTGIALVAILTALNHLMAGPAGEEFVRMWWR